MSADELLVIGAGPVGLAMAKALKGEGIAYAQVDANDGTGGNWRHGVFKATHIVSSKRSTAYADTRCQPAIRIFPAPARSDCVLWRVMPGIMD